MGFMDSMKERATGEMGSRFSQIASQYPIASQVLNMFGGNGVQGLRGLVDAFHQGGLGAIVSSWVGTGANQPISADQVEQALGPDRIQQIAGRLGMDPNAMKERLAEVLPTVVNKMTPKGKIEE